MATRRSTDHVHARRSASWASLESRRCDAEVSREPLRRRTARLWGVRARSRFLHDGRAGSIVEAITLHAGQAAGAARACQSLSAPPQQQLVDFLNTIYVTRTSRCPMLGVCVM